MWQMTSNGTSAAILGASMAGLITARILSDHFDRVTIVERDQLPSDSANRKGVPQGRHAHGLLGMGQEIMGRLFPGLFEDLQAQGATPVDLGYDTGWYQAGCWRARVDSGMVACVQSRPFLEAAIRRRVRGIANVRFLTECDATGLRTNHASSDRISSPVSSSRTKTSAS